MAEKTQKEKLDFNDIIRFVIKNENVTENLLIENFHINRFQVKKSLKKLIKNGVVSEKVNDKYLATVTMEELPFLNLDINTDFSQGNILEHKKECLLKNLDYISLVDNNGDVYTKILDENCKLLPIDGNRVRMATGELKNGDRIVSSYYIYVFGQELSMINKRIAFTRNYHSIGWGVSVVKNKDNSYPQVMDTLLNEPIVSMSYLYHEDVAGKIHFVPNVPSTVDNIEFMCYHQSELRKTPDLPRSILNATSAFEGCKALSFLGTISFDMQDFDNMLKDCPLLEESEIAKVPYCYDKTKMFDKEIEIMSETNILDDDTPLDEWMKSIIERARNL